MGTSLLAEMSRSGRFVLALEAIRNKRGATIHTVAVLIEAQNNHLVLVARWFLVFGSAADGFGRKLNPVQTMIIKFNPCVLSSVCKRIYVIGTTYCFDVVSSKRLAWLFSSCILIDSLGTR